jgi:hypothetical protein
MALASVLRMCACERSSHGSVRSTPVVHRVAQLVEHRSHPALGGLHVAQHAHVVAAVHAHAERVLALARPFEQVGARDHVAHVEAHGCKVALGQRHQVEVRVERIQAHLDGWRLLEERVGVVPRPQRLGGDPEAGREPLVERALVDLPQRRRLALELVEQLEQLALRELVEFERHRVVVREPELARPLVAEPHQHQEIGLDLAADLLAGLPRAPAQVEVARVPQQVHELVVGDALAVEHGAELVEPALE